MKNLEALRAADLRRLAREAEGLAMECVEGIAPPMINFDRHAGDSHCALGVIEARCGVEVEADHFIVVAVADANNYEHPERIDMERRYSGFGHEPATDHAARQSRLVFPLLALRDALNEAARSASRRNK